MNTLVIDIETEKDFREVGGKQNMHLLGVTVVGAYQYANDVFYAYEKEEFSQLEGVFASTQLLIGFNIRHFDIPVLQPHTQFDLGQLEVLDLMDDVERALGFRMGLDNLSRATLGVGKSGVGLEAIDWWREGKKDKVKEYCLQDVRLTRDLYEFGKKNGFVLGDTRDRGRVKISVKWAETTPAVKKILTDAFNRRVAVLVDYMVDGAGMKKQQQKRKIDIHSITQGSFTGYCHLAQNVKKFHIERVMSVIPTDESYILQHDVQQSLI